MTEGKRYNEELYTELEEKAFYLRNNILAPFRKFDSLEDFESSIKPLHDIHKKLRWLEIYRSKEWNGRFNLNPKWKGEDWTITVITTPFFSKFDSIPFGPSTEQIEIILLSEIIPYYYYRFFVTSYLAIIIEQIIDEIDTNPKFIDFIDCKEKLYELFFLSEFSSEFSSSLHPDNLYYLQLDFMKLSNSEGSDQIDKEAESYLYGNVLSELRNHLWNRKRGFASRPEILEDPIDRTIFGQYYDWSLFDTLHRVCTRILDERAMQPDDFLDLIRRLRSTLNRIYILVVEIRCEYFRKNCKYALSLKIKEE